MSQGDDPTIAGLLEKQITTLEANLNRRLDVTEMTVKDRFDRQDRDLREIKQQTTITNGRVTILEKARERTQGAVSVFGWLPPIVTAVITAGLTILIMALSGGIH